ncbi:MAG TPA: hypothetical protein VJ023_07225 [Pyrinomonadaceae bacterium]|nr:hypothetical protein [Pyrinomonadaceae bacterium]
MIYLTLIVALFTLQASNEVEIRIANQSRVTLEDVRVDFASQTESYGTIEAGKATEYRVVRRAYRYARIEALVDGKPALLQPIDYVGEEELKPGRYTYVLKINKKASSEYDVLVLECRKD